MLNIALVSGGTGSIAIQKGLNDLYGIDNYNLDVIINAYDNGKSTGICRTVFENQILGPSDLRKNQLTYFECQYENELLNPDSYESRLHSLFEMRFSATNSNEYYQMSCEYIRNADFIKEEIKKKFIQWIHFFFYEKDGKFRERAINEKYVDFSLSNIFYASCAALNNNSLGVAGSEMAEVLGIEDRVHLISDVSLMLKAETESGYIINDEGEIVCWDNPNDKIKRVILLKDDHEYLPCVDELNKKSVRRVFEQADIIIFSSGTQWSSLIPTYMHDGFKEMIEECSAKKYLVMNNVEDHDMYGVSANELMNILSQFINTSQLTVVLNDNATNSMRCIDDEKYNSIHGMLSLDGSNKHIPNALASLILKDYYGINKEYNLISDLDGTLWDEKGDSHSKKIGKINLNSFEGIILSGNSYEHVSSTCKEFFSNKMDNYIYCDYGNTYFKLNAITDKLILSNDFLIDEDILISVDAIDEFHDKGKVRGGAILTIKPLSDREKKIRLLDPIIEKYKGIYEARIAGRTSIDVMKKSLNKEATLNMILNNMHLSFDDVLYLGNELEKGNEECVKNTGIKTIQVDDVFDTYVFLKTFLYFYGKQ